MLCLFSLSGQSNTKGRTKASSSLPFCCCCCKWCHCAWFFFTFSGRACKSTDTKEFYDRHWKTPPHSSQKPPTANVSNSTRLLAFSLLSSSFLLVALVHACCHSWSLRCCCCVLERLSVTCLQYQSLVALRKASRICWRLLHWRQPSSCRFIPRSHIPSWSSLCGALHRSFPRLPPQRENRDCWRG